MPHLKQKREAPIPTWIDVPRNGGDTRHHCGGILIIAFAAELCGVRIYELMEKFAGQRENWLRKRLKLPNGIPSYNTFRRLWFAFIAKRER